MRFTASEQATVPHLAASSQTIPIRYPRAPSIRLPSMNHDRLVVCLTTETSTLAPAQLRSIRVKWNSGFRVIIRRDETEKDEDGEMKSRKKGRSERKEKRGKIGKGLMKSGNEMPGRVEVWGIDVERCDNWSIYRIGVRRPVMVTRRRSTSDGVDLGNER